MRMRMRMGIRRFWFVSLSIIVLFAFAAVESFVPTCTQNNKLPPPSAAAAASTTTSFQQSNNDESNNIMASSSSSDLQEQQPQAHPFCQLPGDPSLILTTNVDLGDKKMEIMKACSKAICQATGKPESYIAVSIQDKADVIFGGTNDPAALGCLYSIGAIAQTSNGKIQASVTDLLEPYGVDEARIYINFFDVPRANVGWSRRTFAG